MEINYHHQDKYSPNKFHVYIEIDGKKIRESNYLEVDYIIRDISYVRSNPQLVLVCNED